MPLTAKQGGTMIGSFRGFVALAGLAFWANWPFQRASPNQFTARLRKSSQERGGSTLAMRNPARQSSVSQPSQIRVSGLAREEAEDILCWLALTGRTCAKWCYVPDEGFAVYFR
jgi:hypothetical protein